MQKFFTFFSLILLVVIITQSCERISPPVQIGGDLKVIDLSGFDYIPIEFGQLIGVTGPVAGVAHLWFQDDSASIRIIQVNYGKGKLDKNGWIIKRK